MPSSLYAFALLVCPVVMVVMMWMMMRGPKGSRRVTSDVSTSEVARLRAEVEELRSEQRQADAPTETSPTSGA